MSNFIEKLRYDLEFRKKIIGFVVVIITVLLAIGISLWLNISSYNNKNKNQQNTNISSSSSNSKLLITFDNESDIYEKFSNNKVIFNDSIIFYDKDFFFLDYDYRLNYNNKIVSQLKNIYYTDYFKINDNYLLNGPIGQYLFDTKNFELKKVPFRVDNIFYSTEKQYLVIKENSNSLDIKSYKNLGNINTGISFLKWDLTEQRQQNKSNLGKIGNYQLLNVDNKVYLLIFENFNKKGTLELYEINNKNTQKILTIENIQQIKTDTDKIVFTNNLGTFLIDLNENKEKKPVLLDWQIKLKEYNILGKLNLDKCNFNKNRDKFYCFIKKTFGQEKNRNVIDQLLEYNLNDKLLTQKYQNTIISADGVYFDSEDNIYFVAPFPDNYIYKFRK